MNKDYRSSHMSEYYGEIYQATYSEGYYFEQWNKLEKPLVEEIFKLYVENGAKSCLDFACGTGRITAIAENIFSDCYGVDISETMLSEASKVVKKATLIKQDVTKKPLNRKFDVVTAFRFFLNANFDLRLDALTAIHSSLKNDGVFISNIHVNSKSFLGCAYRVRNRVTSSHKANTMGFTEFECLLTNSGFSVERVYWYSFFPRTGWYLSWLSQYLMLPVERVWQSVPFLPKWMAQSFIVICKKA